MKDPVEARVKYHIRDKRVNDLYRCSFVYENDKKDDHTGFEQMKRLLDKLMHIEATIKDKQPSIEPAPTKLMELPPPTNYDEIGNLLERCELQEHLRAFKAAQVDLKTLSAFSPEELDAALKEIGLCLGARDRFKRLLRDDQKKAARAKKEEKKRETKEDEKARLAAKEKAEEEEEEKSTQIMKKARESTWVVIKVDTNVNDSTHPQLVKLYIQVKVALDEGDKYVALEIAIISKDSHEIMNEPHECVVKPHTPDDADERGWRPFAACRGPKIKPEDETKYMVTIHDLYKVVRLNSIPDQNKDELTSLVKRGEYAL